MGWVTGLRGPDGRFMKKEVTTNASEEIVLTLNAHPQVNFPHKTRRKSKSRNYHGETKLHKWQKTTLLIGNKSNSAPPAKRQCQQKTTAQSTESLTIVTDHLSDSDLEQAIADAKQAQPEFRIRKKLFTSHVQRGCKPIRKLSDSELIENRTLRDAVLFLLLGFHVQ